MPRGEKVHQSIESMNEKAPEEAERGSALRMSSPWTKVARRPGAERMCPSEYMGPGARCAFAWRCLAGECTAENLPPSNTDVGPQEISEKSGGSRSTSFPIDRPAIFARFCTLRAKKTLALRALGVQPKIRPCVYGCKHPAPRGCSHCYLRWAIATGPRGFS